MYGHSLFRNIGWLLDMLYKLKEKFDIYFIINVFIVEELFQISDQRWGNNENFVFLERLGTTTQIILSHLFKYYIGNI